jgi:hypothetical protein
MKHVWMLTGLILVALAGCTSTDQRVAAKDDGNKIVCEGETKLGSTIKRKSCMTKLQAEEKKRRSDQTMETIRNSPTSTINGIE